MGQHSARHRGCWSHRMRGWCLWRHCLGQQCLDEHSVQHRGLGNALRGSVDGTVCSALRGLHGGWSRHLAQHSVSARASLLCIVGGAERWTGLPRKEGTGRAVSSHGMAICAWLEHGVEHGAGRRLSLHDGRGRCVRRHALQGWSVRSHAAQSWRPGLAEGAGRGYGVARCAWGAARCRSEALDAGGGSGRQPGTRGQRVGLLTAQGGCLEYHGARRRRVHRTPRWVGARGLQRAWGGAWGWHAGRGVARRTGLTCGEAWGGRPARRVTRHAEQAPEDGRERGGGAWEWHAGHGMARPGGLNCGERGARSWPVGRHDTPSRCPRNGLKREGAHAEAQSVTSGARAVL